MPGSLEAADFSLEHTLECGQFFRWRKSGDVYEVCRKERLFTVWQEGDRLHFSDATPAFIRYFFSLDHDLPAIARSVDRDPLMHEALRRYPGLRLLRQDPWECAAAFITSIASNIPRITRNIEDMAAAFGPMVRSQIRSMAQFPRPEKMGDAAKLRRLGLGFRGRYLSQAARLCAAGLLDDISYMNQDEGREALMVIPGVAEKVADCILLFAYGHRRAFPIDTWIRKAMTLTYFDGKPANDRRLLEFAGAHYGEYAGYAQQYLYTFARRNWDEVEALAARADSRRALHGALSAMPKPAPAASFRI